MGPVGMQLVVSVFVGMQMGRSDVPLPGLENRVQCFSASQWAPQ